MIPLILTRPLVILDCEMTGLIYETDRIIEIGLMVMYPEKSCSECDGTGTVIDAPSNVLDGHPYSDPCSDCNGTGRRPILEWRTLVDPQMPIKEGVHGITDEKVHGCQRCGRQRDAHPYELKLEEQCLEYKPWPLFAQLAPRLAKFLRSVDFAGKNIRFDLGFLTAEFTRANVHWSFVNAAIIDADAIERLKEPRDLSSLYTRRTGKEPQGAHQALDDVHMTAELLEAQFALWPDLPRDPAAIHALLWANWIDNEGKFRFDDKGVPTMWFGKHRGLPMADVPGDYWDFILKPTEKFSEEMKQIARKAKLKQFPEKV